MRGKATRSYTLNMNIRITPAYAGKSQQISQCACVAGDHPRICGEKSGRASPIKPHRGSPPHMRGKGLCFRLEGRPGGITPAYAGKSAWWCRHRRCRWDHPRICGEKQWAMTCYSGQQGSPPHMRGKEVVSGLQHLPAGITPAYAGKRTYSPTVFCRFWDHPRICGEKTKKIP